MMKALWIGAFTLLGLSCQANVFKQLAFWRTSLASMTHYGVLEPKRTGPVKGPSFLSLGDLADFKFDGEVDEQGLPQGEGVLTSDDDDDEGSEFCLRSKCQRAIKSAYSASFLNGRANGPVHLRYQDGGTTWGLAHFSVLDGIYKEVGPERRYVEIGVYEAGIKKRSWLFVVTSWGEVASFWSLEKDGEGCMFLIKSGVGLCGQFSEDGAAVEARLCETYTEGTEYKGVLQVSCAEYSANNSKIYTFDVPTTFGGNVVDVAPTQALWLYLAAVKQRPEPNTIFIDKSIESLSELDDVSRLLPTNVDSQVDMMRCRHALDLRQYPAATFYEYAALSFPGSGSKWFFQMVAFATGIQNYYLWIEHEPTYRKGSALLIKTHHQRAELYTKIVKGLYRHSEALSWRLNHIRYFGGRAILLIRNPYEAVISHWNHGQAGEHDVLHNMLQSLKTKEFLKFAMIEIDLWYELIEDWVTISSDMLVIHFENFMTSRSTELRKIGQFLHLALDEVRLSCLDEVIVSHHKRSGRPEVPQDHFSTKVTDKFNAVIEKTQQLLVRHGHQALPVEKYRHYKSEGSDSP